MLRKCKFFVFLWMLVFRIVKYIESFEYIFMEFWKNINIFGLMCISMWSLFL